MFDLLWTNVRNIFNPELMGSLPNVVIKGPASKAGRRSSIYSAPTAGHMTIPRMTKCLPCQLPAGSSPLDGTPILS